MSATKRNRQKSPFLILVRFGGWPEGQYLVLPGEPFESTRDAESAIPAKLEEQGIDIAATVKEHGKMWVAVASFSKVFRHQPSIGYQSDVLNPMDVVPVGGDEETEDPSEAAPAATDVEIAEADATSPETPPEPVTEPVDPPAPPPEPSPEPSPLPAEDPTPSGDSSPPPESSPPSDPSPSPSPSSAPATDPVPEGEDQTGGWDDMGEPVVEPPAPAAPVEPAVTPPAEPPASADDVLV